MSKRIDKSSRTSRVHSAGRHRFEHWYVDNQVYSATARVRGRFAAFAFEDAKAVFWDRFDHYPQRFGFTPFITFLLDNHYHTLGYLRVGENLRTMMQRLHGSVAELVNDLLPERHERVWRDQKGREYFDGCIRDEEQFRLAYRHVLTQRERHGLRANYRTYPHTRVNIDLDRAVRRAIKLSAFLEGVPYPRYERRARRRTPPA
jgi:hypothetical protein